MASPTTTVSTEPHDYLFKVLLVGDSGVGKSSILIRYTEDVFDEDIASTIGVDFKVKNVVAKGKTVKITIWDTAGQERFRTLTSSYYRGAHGVVLVFDVGRRETLTNLEMWMKEIDVYSTTPDVVTLLVGNKVDVDNRKVDRAEAEDLARRHSMMYIETSARTKVGIHMAFEELIMKILDTPSLAKSGQTEGNALQLGGKPSQGGGCSC